MITKEYKDKTYKLVPGTCEECDLNADCLEAPDECMDYAQVAWKEIDLKPNLTMNWMREEGYLYSSEMIILPKQCYVDAIE